MLYTAVPWKLINWLVSSVFLSHSLDERKRTVLPSVLLRPPPRSGDCRGTPCASSRRPIGREHPGRTWWCQSPSTGRQTLQQRPWAGPRGFNWYSGTCERLRWLMRNAAFLQSASWWSPQGSRSKRDNVPRGKTSSPKVRRRERNLVSVPPKWNKTKSLLWMETVSAIYF